MAQYRKGALYGITSQSPVWLLGKVTDKLDYDVVFTMKSLGVQINTAAEERPGVKLSSYWHTRNPCGTP
jgi:hypothetical protein